MSETQDTAVVLRLKVMDHQQAIVARLAGNSFLIKGWAITLATALLGIALKDNAPAAAPVAFLAVVPTLCFWLLDGYYLAAERAVRDRYEQVARAPGEPAPAARLKLGAGPVLCAAFGWVTLLLYAALLVCEVAVGVGLFGPLVSRLSI